ncbi:MAG: BCCT family transporter, partial [Desulfobacterales bacterium]|nr:BCCT family transporter [Desulfobacterales bacterium]
MQLPAFRTLRPLAFFPPFLILSGLAIASLVMGAGDGQRALELMTLAFDRILDQVGWLYALTSLGLLCFVGLLCLSSKGNIRFGGAHAVPEISYWNWFAMTLCAGIAIGIVFWGVAEPLMHLKSPPQSLDIRPFSSQSAVFALSQIFVEWTFTPYAIYTVCGLAAAWTCYNGKGSRSISATLEPVLGKRVHSSWGQLMDGVVLFGLVGGVVASLGEGVLQIAGGLEFCFELPRSPLVWGMISLVIVLTYCLSAYTGVMRGIKRLSDLNAKLFLGLMVFVLVVGPTGFILNLGVESAGDFLDHIFSRHLFLGAVSGDAFPKWWTLFFFAFWYAWAPVTGMFLARMAYGRTVREFILVNMAAPALFGMVWFSIFGGTAIHMELVDKLGLSAALDRTGLEGAMFYFLNHLPLARKTDGLPGTAGASPSRRTGRTIRLPRIALPRTPSRRTAIGRRETDRGIGRLPRKS